MFRVARGMSQPARRRPTHATAIADPDDDEEVRVRHERDGGVDERAEGDVDGGDDAP